MKIFSSSVVLLIGVLSFIVAPSPSHAQNPIANIGLHHHYHVIQMPTLGGDATAFPDATNNIAVINRRGELTTASETSHHDPNAPFYWWNPTGNIAHAVVWLNGSMTDLGALPGTNNSIGDWISDNGIVAGYSENGSIDPSVPDLPEISAVIWRNDQIVDLGTLPGGGYQSATISVNNRGQATGVATNLVPDPNSLLQYNLTLWDIPYSYQLRAFFWDEKTGMRDLGTLGTGTNAEAVRINNYGEIIGNSYISSAPGACNNQETGAFLWDRIHGMKNLGSFGGSCTLANDINDRGQVVGGSLVSGDRYERAYLWQKDSFRDLGGSLGGQNTGALAINQNGISVGFAYHRDENTYHATLWIRPEEMIDLGSVGDDPCSFAQGINEAGQVVGDSTPNDCQAFDVSRGFLWENGSIADLNALILEPSQLYIRYAYAINARGEIAVNGVDHNGLEQAALLIPCDENHPGVEGCDYSMTGAGGASSPPSASKPSMPGRSTVPPRPNRRLHLFSTGTRMEGVAR